MACEVASALVFLHSAPEPIIHMDLKPGGWGRVAGAGAVQMCVMEVDCLCSHSKCMAYAGVELLLRSFCL
jgi:hypothetical protein